MCESAYNEWARVMLLKQRPVTLGSILALLVTVLDFLSIVATLYSYSYKTVTANTKIDLGVSSYCFGSADSSSVFIFPPIK